MKSYPYSPDEFDAASRSGGPRGVHRAPRSRWSKWWPFLVVLIVFPALAYAGVTWFSDWEGFGGGEPEQAAPTQQTPQQTPTPEVTPTPTPEETPEPPPVDLARPVEVLNATTVAGLAGRGGERLEEEGFTSVTTGNWSGASHSSSAVYYGDPEDVSTANLAATTLGIATVQESAELAPDGLVVVLAADSSDL